jgi:hypothetical protein
MPPTRNFLPMQCGPKPPARAFYHFASMLLLTLAMAGTVTSQTLPSGPFGFVMNSTFSDPATQGGAAMLGLMNFNGSGQVNGSYTFEEGSVGNGSPATFPGTFTGTYSSSPDGTGTVSIMLSNPQDVSLSLAMVTDNNGLQLVVTGCTGSICNLGAAVMSGVGSSGSTTPVTQKSLNGSYGEQDTKVSPTPETNVGVLTFDGDGNVLHSTTVITPGPVLVSTTLLGTYSVNTDGTGAITYPPQSGSPEGETSVFVKNGKSGLFVLQTNRTGNGVLYGIGELQVAAQATVSPISITYPSQKVGTASSAHRVTLKNNLSTALTIQPTTFTGADPSDFVVATTTCGVSLAAKSSCTIGVVFKPAATGPRAATLNVTDSASSSPQTVSLTGIGD